MQNEQEPDPKVQDLEDMWDAYQEPVAFFEKPPELVFEPEELARIEIDLQFLQNEAYWSRWPIVPMIRWVEEQKILAVVVGGRGPKVYRIDATALFQPINPDSLSEPILEYDTFEQMLRDGWEVNDPHRNLSQHAGIDFRNLLKESDEP